MQFDRHVASRVSSSVLSFSFVIICFMWTRLCQIVSRPFADNQLQFLVQWLRPEAVVPTLPVLTTAQSCSHSPGRGTQRSASADPAGGGRRVRDERDPIFGSSTIASCQSISLVWEGSRPFNFRSALCSLVLLYLHALLSAAFLCSFTVLLCSALFLLLCCSFTVLLCFVLCSVLFWALLCFGPALSCSALFCALLCLCLALFCVILCLVPCSVLFFSPTLFCSALFLLCCQTLFSALLCSQTQLAMLCL